MKHAVRRLGLALFGAHEGKLFARLGTLLFLAALVSVHLRHEAWRDELHCWSVGRNATGLWDLMFGDRRYDGHPLLWYYVIYLVSRVSRGVVALHALTITISSVAAYLWLRHSKAPRVVRVLLLPSYLFFYEYGVVCRSYGLGVLLLFSFCATYRKHEVRYVLLAALLALLALTSVYGAIMSGALALFLFTRDVHVFAKDVFGCRQALSTRPGYWQGVAIYVFCIFLTAATTLPADDEHFATGWNTDLGGPQVRKALLDFWWAFLPTNNDWSSESYLGMETGSLAAYLPWLAAALFLGCLLALRRAPAVAVSFGFATLVMGIFQQVKYPGGLRHVGNIVMFLLACGWLAQRELQAPRRLRLLWVLVVPCLLVQLVSGARATAADWSQPFSGALQTANFVRKTYPADTLILGSSDFVAEAVAGYLDRGILFPETSDFGQAVVAHNRRYNVTEASILSISKSNLDGRDRLLLVLNFPLSERHPDVEIKQTYVSDASIVAEERFWVYEATRSPELHPRARP